MPNQHFLVQIRCRFNAHFISKYENENISVCFRKKPDWFVGEIYVLIFYRYMLINNQVDSWSRSRYPFLLRFGHGAILVQINLQHSQAQPCSICTRVIYLTKTSICGASHREVVSTMLKVFGVIRPRLDQNPRPPELSAYTLQLHFRVGIHYILFYKTEIHFY